MFNDLIEMKEKGVKIYQTSKVLEGIVDTSYEGLTVGKDNLTDLVYEFVHCYGKKIKVEIKVEVNL